MIEVEVKAKIDNFEDMREKLNNLGAVKTKEEFQEDIYFNSPIVDFAKTDEATSKNIKNSGISISPRISSVEPTSATVAIPNFNISVEETTKSAVPSSVIMCRFST